MNDPSLQQRYDFALDYIRSLEERIQELERELEVLKGLKNAAEAEWRLA